MLNIVIPMAGRGSRFANAGFIMPKPLIDIYGHPMIEYVVKNLKPKFEHRFIFICQEDHMKKYALEDALCKMTAECEIVTTNYITDGAACTVLLAEKYINNDDALMIANSDQFVNIDINDYLSFAKNKDGLIMTMPASDPKWSFIKFDNNNNVTMVREKEVISNEATVGIYNYRFGRDFVEYAHQMINKNIRVNNEFYVAPVYNEMINDGKRIGFYNIGSNMYGLGIPNDLYSFMSTSICKSLFVRT